MSSSSSPGLSSFEHLTHPACDEPLKAHLFGKLNFVKTVADFFHALANLHEKYAQEMQSIVTSYKYKAQSDRPKYGSSLVDLWDAILHIVDLDAKCHSELAQSLLKNAASALGDFYDSKTQLYNRIMAHRANLLHLIEKNTLEAHEKFRTYCEAHSRHRTNSSKINKAAMLRAHNDYVLQVQATNVIIDLFHADETPLIMKDLHDADCCTSDVFCHAADSFVAGSIHLAAQQKLRYEAVRNDELHVDRLSDLAAFVKHCQTLVPNAAHAQAGRRQPANLEFRVPPTVKNSEPQPVSSELVSDKLVAAEMRERLCELERYCADLSNNVHSASDVLGSFQSMLHSHSHSHSQANLNNGHGHGHGRDRKLCDLQVDVCRKSCELRVQVLELAAVRKKVELLGKATVQPPDPTPSKLSRSRTPSVSERDNASLSNDTPKLLSVAAWKQTIAWWRKDDKPKDSNSNSNSGATPETTQIDPIYSLLRCATNLPRRLSAAAGAGAGAGAGNTLSKPTSPVRKPDYNQTSTPTSSSAYQLAPAQNSNNTLRRCSVNVPRKLNSSAELISTTQKRWLPTSSSVFSAMHNATLCGQCQRPVGVGVEMHSAECDCICHKPDMLPTINLQHLKPSPSPTPTPTPTPTGRRKETEFDIELAS